MKTACVFAMALLLASCVSARPMAAAGARALRGQDFYPGKGRVEPYPPGFTFSAGGGRVSGGQYGITGGGNSGTPRTVVVQGRTFERPTVTASMPPVTTLDLASIVPGVKAAGATKPAGAPPAGR
ncbi:MAG: hypothetical protein J3K34DRAFT_179550 [Monoraphidium minutum]|nr:MAG: hypothetical protein J3K34DRAFT_179550 [Monoraphidium minutum]